MAPPSSGADGARRVGGGRGERPDAGHGDGERRPVPCRPRYDARRRGEGGGADQTTDIVPVIRPGVAIAPPSHGAMQLQVKLPVALK